MEADWTQAVLDLDPESEAPGAPRPLGAQGAFPYSITDTIKVLGVPIDRHLAPGDHCKAISAKSRVRQGTLASISHREGGLETAAPPMTHEALVNSLLRYALNAARSGTPEDPIRRLDVNVTEPAARRSTGL